jgi:hypothetical protein
MLTAQYASGASTRQRQQARQHVSPTAPSLLLPWTLTLATAGLALLLEKWWWSGGWRDQAWLLFAAAPPDMLVLWALFLTDSAGPALLMEKCWWYVGGVTVITPKFRGGMFWRLFLAADQHSVQLQLHLRVQRRSTYLLPLHLLTC